MKRVRLLVLTGLIIAALAAAVVPAVAGVSPTLEQLNASFEGDKNGDNLPDKWNVKGDILRVCDHQYASVDNCMMVFKPSNKGAALWQILDAQDEEWIVVTEEAVACDIGQGYLGAINFDSDRAFYGGIADFVDGTRLTAYNAIDGGTYPISPQFFDITVPTCPPALPEPVLLKWGVFALPGDGHLGVDWIFP